MNLIDRDKLIEEYVLDSEADFLGMLCYRPQAVIDRINAQPIVTVNEWIPVSERLPEEEVEVLLYVKSKVPHKHFKVHLGHAIRRNKFSIKTDKEDEFYGCPNYYDVIAWKPIEPYIGDKE